MVRVEGCSLEEYRGGRVEQRPVGDVGVTSDPANVRRAPVDILVLLGKAKGRFSLHL